jgi:hypothetical protein
MNPQEAKALLDQMGVTEPRPFGKFAIVRLPKPKELHTFVRAIKTLGAWSTGNKNRVEVECGVAPDELIFRV